MIKEAKLPKFIIFMFEGNFNKDGSYIPGYKTVSLIKLKIKLKNFNYSLVGGICTPTDNHFTPFIYFCQKEYFNLELGGNYYYDSMQYNGGIIKKDNI